jgi:hypothetical protein
MSRTLEDAMIDSLEWKGLFPDEARQVLGQVKSVSIVHEGTELRWSGPASEYPVEILKAIEQLIRGFAQGWIERTRPDHHARRNFVRS